MGSSRPPIPVGVRNGWADTPMAILTDPFTSWHDLGEWVMVPAEAGAPAGGPPMPGGGRPGGETPMRQELRNQPMKELGEYTAGVKDGTWRYFDEQGERIRTERWTLGKLTATEE